MSTVLSVRMTPASTFIPTICKDIAYYDSGTSTSEKCYLVCSAKHRQDCNGICDAYYKCLDAHTLTTVRLSSNGNDNRNDVESNAPPTAVTILIVFLVLTTAAIIMIIAMTCMCMPKGKRSCKFPFISRESQHPRHEYPDEDKPKDTPQIQIGTCTSLLPKNTHFGNCSEKDGEVINLPFPSISIRGVGDDLPTIESLDGASLPVISLTERL